MSYWDGWEIQRNDPKDKRRRQFYCLMCRRWAYTSTERSYEDGLCCWGRDFKRVKDSLPLRVLFGDFGEFIVPLYDEDKEWMERIIKSKGVTYSWEENRKTDVVGQYRLPALDGWLLGDEDDDQGAIQEIPLDILNYIDHNFEKVNYGGLQIIGEKGLVFLEGVNHEVLTFFRKMAESHHISLSDALTSMIKFAFEHKDELLSRIKGARR